MADMTTTTAFAHAPSTADKTAIAGKVDDILTLLDTAVTNTTTGTSQVDTATIAGTPTGGTYTLTFTDSIYGARTTGAIAYNAVAATVQTAIRLLAGLSLTTVSSSGTTPNFTHTITYKGTQAAITLSRTSSMTGGTNSLTVANSTPYAELPHLSQSSCDLMKNKLIDWCEELASELK
jgi:hypothetical protein